MNAARPQAPQADSAPLLGVDAVSKAFGGVRALDRATFSLSRGHVHGLIGPNGAGKTTLINIISGLQHADSGAVLFDGRQIDRLPAHRIAALGVRRTYQNIRLFPAMSVLENVSVGQHLLRRESLGERLLFAPRGRRENATLHAAAEALLEQVGLAGRANAGAGALAYGDQRRLEIARALASRPQLLLLDEPAAGMNHSEATALGALLRRLAATGLTMLLIEHNVQLVMAVCDSVTVLDFGKVIAAGVPAEVAANQAVVAAYLGSDEAEPPG
jgi:ABC-type branched-subunit amino acid transport system ATPase component